jgi:threonine dehydratase
MQHSEGAAGLVGLAEVQEAAKRIEGKAHITPILTCATLDALTNGCNLFFKCENLQRVPYPPPHFASSALLMRLSESCSHVQVGAFKIRGACNAVFKLTDDEARKGVVTHSSGNHAQGRCPRPRLRCR